MSCSDIQIRVLAEKLPFSFKHLVEVGVGYESDLVDFIDGDVRVELVEPIPENLHELRNLYGKKENVTIHPFAIGEKPDSTVIMKSAGKSSFITTVEAPHKGTHMTAKSPEIEVPAKVMWEFDDGTIDFLTVDAEGSEWFVIKSLLSRPKVIVLELGKFMPFYDKDHWKNPYLEEINRWMGQNNYMLIDRWEEDFVFMRFTK